MAVTKSHYIKVVWEGNERGKDRTKWGELHLQKPEDAKEQCSLGHGVDKGREVGPGLRSPNPVGV